MFIRQSIPSDYCAVYATAIMLSLLGCPLSRSEALRLFAVGPRNWKGATNQNISAAIARAQPAFSTHWWLESIHGAWSSASDERKMGRCPNAGLNFLFP